MCTPTRKVSTYREHQAIVGAIKRHDVNAAMRGMADHLDTVMTELIDFSERNPEAVSEVRETAAA
jgi:DNA-binding GntR family transcriptional regulator